MSRCEELDKHVIGEVIPGLFIGSLWSVKEISKRLHSKWTINSLLSSPKLKKFIDIALEDIRKNHPRLILKHELWKLDDKVNSDFLSDRLEQILHVMNEAIAENSRCLVHCAFGISRSATVCASWLLFSQRATTVSVALDMIRKARPEIMPNMGFLANLRALEQSQGNARVARERLSK